jgi:hypothetical protein
VVSFWIVATIAGVMAAGPASEALDQEFSVPEKEGWETNLAIADSTRARAVTAPPFRSRYCRTANPSTRW